MSRKIYYTKLKIQQCIALKRVSFDVGQGEFLAIMGPSGSGENDAFKYHRLARPPDGRRRPFWTARAFLKYARRDMSEFRRKHLGFVFQDFNLLDTLFFERQYPFAAGAIANPACRDGKAPRAVARALGITHLLKKFPYEVSGGEKQRAAIAPRRHHRPAADLGGRTHGRARFQIFGQSAGQFPRAQRKRQDHPHGHAQRFCRKLCLARAVYPRRGDILADYRGDNDNHAFFERIVANLSVLSDGGADVG